MTLLQKISLVYFFIFVAATSLNYVPGITDEDGLAFGVFALDIYDDALHFFSAVWALLAAMVSHRSAKIFLIVFGTLYLGDGLLGLATGSGYLDLGIVFYGIQDIELGFRILANLPHIALGSVAAASGVYLDRS